MFGVSQILQYLENPRSIQRLEVCVMCEKYDKKQVRCQECGCFLKGKVLLPSAKCPLGKW